MAETSTSATTGNGLRRERACRVSDLGKGEVLRLPWRPQVALFNVDGEFVAIFDRCTHMNLPLSYGYIDDAVIECAYHGARFDLRTGTSLDYEKPIGTLATEIEGDDVFILVPADLHIDA